MGQGLGKLGSGGSIPASLAQGAAAYGGAKFLGGGIDAAKAGASPSGILSGAVGALPGGGYLNSALSGALKTGVGGALTGALGGAGGGLRGALGGAASALTGGGSSGGGGINPLILALAAAEAGNAASLGKKSTDYATNAYDTVNQSYADRAGLRKAGIAGMLNPKTPDLSGLDAIRRNIPWTPPAFQPADPTMTQSFA